MKSPRSGPALPLSRPPLERMLRIHQAIQGGQYPNASTLARDLEVSTKSIHRDVEFMRDRLGLPVAYDDRRFGYFYSEEVSGFPTLQITEGELFALLVAEKALQQYRGTHFEKPLLSAFKKISASLPDTISVDLQEWEKSISFRTRAEPLLDLEIFDTLAKATVRRQQLAVQYRKPGLSHPEERIIDPYHLANINGEWFLFGYCHLREDIRTFVPARIVSAHLTGRQFEPAVRFSVEQRLRDSFGVHSGEGKHLIRVRFTAWAADYVREKKWHRSQALKELPEGGVELELKLSSLLEVERWILGWGGHAIPLEPPELVESIRKAARKMLEETNGGGETRLRN